LADLGNQQAEQEVNIALAENEGFLRQEIDQALARLEEGKFGICEECHGAIGAERLKALPYTRLCIRCANRLQKEMGS
jgi:RNA polymerase-binding transcription factor DksA